MPAIVMNLAVDVNDQTTDYSRCFWLIIEQVVTMSDEKLAEIFQGFKEALPGKVNEIAEQWQQVQGPEDTANLEAFGGLCHSLAGTAGTFGFEDIGDEARAIENIVRPCLKQGQAPSGEQMATISRLLAALQDSIDKLD